MFSGVTEFLQIAWLFCAQETNAALANSDEFLGELLRRLETDGNDPESSHWESVGTHGNHQKISKAHWHQHNINKRSYLSYLYIYIYLYLYLFIHQKKCDDCVVWVVWFCLTSVYLSIYCVDFIYVPGIIHCNVWMLEGENMSLVQGGATRPVVWRGFFQAKQCAANFGEGESYIWSSVKNVFPHLKHHPKVASIRLGQ